jgi:hypothetical protein
MRSMLFNEDNSQTTGSAKAEPTVPGPTGNKPNPKSVAMMVDGDVRTSRNFTPPELEPVSDGCRNVLRWGKSHKSTVSLPRPARNE